ncbi:HAMP domain-containing protein [bacterium]|nr:HAMP domain-containing protein [bacterium]
MSWWARRSARTRLAIVLIAAQATVVVCLAVIIAFAQARIVYSQLDQQLDDDIENAEQLLERAPEGGLRWRAGQRADGHAEPEADRSIEVFGADGNLLYRSRTALAVDLGSPPSVPEHMRNGPASRAFPGDGHLRVLSGGCAVNGLPVVIRAARSDKLVRDQLALLGGSITAALVAMVLMATLTGYAIAGRALAPLAKMAERAKTITAEKLSERLPVENPRDELGRLAIVMNEAFARLERSFEQMRRFTADASHELRTPLTAIRTVGEVALREGVDAAASREVIGSMLEETDRLARLVDSLLTLSRADAGRVKLNPEPTDLAELAREVVGHLGVLAEEKRQTIAVESQGPVPVLVDRLVLRQAVINVVDNAIKYGPEAGPIRVVVESKPQGAVLAVVDRGPGIAVEHRARVFDRFYRVDASRSREDGGAGLGLAIARWAVEANGGCLELESKPGEGSTFRIVLPRRPPA